MKKILLLVVLAVAVGTTWAQRRYISQAPAPKDRNVETRYVNKIGQVSNVYCDNIIFIVTPTDVEVLVPKEGKMEHLRYVTRNDYGTHFIARGVRFEGYVRLRAVVENNSFKTVIRLYDGDTVVKSFWFDQPQKPLSPQYPRNRRRSW